MPHVRASTLLGLALLGCEAEATEIPGPSTAQFRDEVYPVLLRDCGFVQCHGDSDRFFVIHGPGRTRLDPETDVFDPPTDDELAVGYESARGMLASDRGVLESPLLSKPLEGRGHGGLDRFGRNVWQPGDPAWRSVEQWARGIP
ncbi:hypothetical protein ACNOYE_22335 [Nannocystaceae bacterium ST9]